MKLVVSGKKAVLTVIFGFCLMGIVLSAGFAKAVSAGAKGTAVPILMYHSVGYNKTVSKYILPPEDFEEDLRWLSENG